VNTATVDVVLHLINSKCVYLYRCTCTTVFTVYGLQVEVCPLNTGDMQFLIFFVNGLLISGVDNWGLMGLKPSSPKHQLPFVYC